MSEENNNSHFTQGDRVMMITHGVELKRAIDDIKDISKKLTDLTTQYVPLQDFKDHLETDADHERRIRSLETFVNTLTGKLVIMSALSGTIVAGVFLVINHVWK